MRQFVDTMFIINNFASFYLMWKDNLAKHQNAAKYHDHDCSFQNTYLIWLIGNSWTFKKHFWNIWNFILLLTEDDSALNVAWKIMFQWLVAYKPVACIKGVYIKPYNDTGDSFLISGPNAEFLKDSISQALKIDGKDFEQLSPFVSQGKNTMHWLILSNTTGVLVSFFQIQLITVQNNKNGFSQLPSLSN